MMNRSLPVDSLMPTLSACSQNAENTEEVAVKGDDALNLITQEALYAHWSYRAEEARDGARFYEGIFDRIGSESLDKELELIEATWPEVDVVVLRPDDRVLSAARPNPMSVEALIPTFLRTLAFLRRELAQSHVWDLLRSHLVK